MGLMSFLGIGRTAARVAEVFVANKTEGARQQHAEHMASLAAHSAEFARARGGWFDQLVDGLNRLPRPALAMGTLGLFVYAMADPVSFGARMQGLALMPDPLWWLLGAIVSFYFGARELHHFRSIQPAAPQAVAEVAAKVEAVEALEKKAKRAPDVLQAEAAQPAGPSTNAAVAAWRASTR